MQEIVSCPSCQRKLQVPDTLVGQDVQCPTCGATFIAGAASKPYTPPAAPTYPLAPTPSAPREREPAPSRSASYDPYDDPAGMRRRDLAPHRGGLILTLGILSLVTCVLSVLGPVAWAMASTDLQEMRAGRMDPSGESDTNVGRILGMISTGLLTLGVLACCCVAVAPKMRL